MCDLISRQALCEYALNQKDKCVTPNDIMRFPSAQPEQQWIPCSERLPEKSKGNEDTEYLVTIDNGEFKYVTSEFWIYWYGNWKWNCDGVIAWMPLPKAYGGDAKLETMEYI